MVGTMRKTETKVAEPKVEKTTSASARLRIDTSKQYEAILSTSMGDITIALAATATPITVNNFITLAEKNFMIRPCFIESSKGFMIQGGDPEGTGARWSGVYI